ncbi:MAG TPA: hypothetical protein PKM20_00590 [Nitrosomonas sp.]|nr:hypothetical protein [Nitrosomonas sp.]
MSRDVALGGHSYLASSAAQQITVNSNSETSDNLCKAMTGILLAKAASGQQKAVLEVLLALDETEQQLFEVLILALQALEDRSVLCVPYRPRKTRRWTGCDGRHCS